MAEQLKEEGEPYVIGFTAAQYEGYVVGFNTILSSFGGTIVNEDSTKVDGRRQDRQGARDAQASSRPTGLASKSLSNSQEPEVFAQLQNGEAAFILNWPYVLSAMEAADRRSPRTSAYAQLPESPTGEPAQVTLGGMNFAISKYSKHPERGLRRRDVPAHAGDPAADRDRGRRAAGRRRASSSGRSSGRPTRWARRCWTS